MKNRIVGMIVDKMVSIWCMDDKDRHAAHQRLAANMLSSQDEYEAAYDDYCCIEDVLKRLWESRSISHKEFTLITVFLYLIVVEGQVCDAINFISYLLVTMGHDLYSLTKRKYVKDDMKEIRKVEMSTKIQFLKNHGFGALVKEYDSTFRNDMAHHNYRVDERGVLRVRGKPVNLGSKLFSAWKIPRLLNEAIAESSEKLQKQENLSKKKDKEFMKT